MSFNCESTGIKCEFIGFNCQFISFKCGFISFNLVNYTRPALLWQRTLWGMLSDNKKDLFLVRKWNLLKCHQYRACLLNTHTGTINLCSKSIPVKTAENNVLGEIPMIYLIMPIRLQPVSHEFIFRLNKRWWNVAHLTITQVHDYFNEVNKRLNILSYYSPQKISAGKVDPFDKLGGGFWPNLFLFHMTVFISKPENPRQRVNHAVRNFIP